MVAVVSFRTKDSHCHTTQHSEIGTFSLSRFSLSRYDGQNQADLLDHT